jgi:hypothetical protein
MPRTSFDPQIHGFPFPNRFENVLPPLLARPLGFVKTTDRCGGMAYAALDFFHAGIALPAMRAEDYAGDRLSERHWLARYIFRRQVASLSNLRARNFVTWIVRSDEGLMEATRAELPALMRAIDTGRPVVLGMIATRSVLDLTTNHQVVAYGYEADPGSGETRVLVYDPNSPWLEVALRVAPGATGVPASNRAFPWRGFFVHAYHPRTPPTAG